MWIAIGLLLVVLITLLAIRIIGERVYEVKPEPIPESPLEQPTCLHLVLAELASTEGKDETCLVYPLANAETALLTRIYLIDQATTCLDVQYYLFHDDEAGRAALEALAEAAQRGVKVRLLLDDMDLWRREGRLIRLVAETPNLSIRVFNPFWLRLLRTIEFVARFPRVTRRMHNKSLTADAIVSIVGGRNIGNEYFNFKTDVAFADFDVLIGGYSIARIVQSFQEYWYSGLAIAIQQLGTPAADAVYVPWRAQLREALQHYRDTLAQEKSRIDVWRSSNYTNLYEGPLRLLYDPPHKVVSKLYDNSGDMVPDLLALLSSAKQELVISSPYFVPGKYGLSVFRKLRERGVNITILTNSFAANDVAVVHAGYMAYRKALLAMGVCIYELIALNDSRGGHAWSLLGSKRASLHAKTFIVDRQKVFVGSFNLDPRSAIHNTEMGVVFENADYAQRAVAELLSYAQTRAYRLDLNRWRRVIWNAPASKNSKAVIYKAEPEMGIGDRLFVRTISFLPVEWLL